MTHPLSQAHFHYRVAAVMLHASHVLLHRGLNEQTWSLPGGRVDVMETSAAALVRELREELGVEAPIGRLLWIVENFYADAGETYHEVGLYYSVDVPVTLLDAFSTQPFYGIELDKQLLFQWMPLERISQCSFNPSVLRDAFAAVPEHISHLMCQDNH